MIYEHDTVQETLNIRLLLLTRRESENFQIQNSLDESSYSDLTHALYGNSMNRIPPCYHIQNWLLEKKKFCSADCQQVDRQKYLLINLADFQTRVTARHSRNISNILCVPISAKKSSFSVSSPSATFSRAPYASTLNELQTLNETRECWTFAIYIRFCFLDFFFSSFERIEKSESRGLARHSWRHSFWERMWFGWRSESVRLLFRAQHVLEISINLNRALQSKHILEILSATKRLHTHR